MAIELSSKIWKMLKELPRQLNEQPTEQAEIEAKLLKANCPITHPIVDFQLQLGGFQYKLHRDIMELGMGRKPRIIFEDGHWLCEFLDSPTSQGFLFMGDNGVLYAESATTAFASSIKVFLENEAMLYFRPENWKSFSQTSLSSSNISKIVQYLKTKKDLTYIAKASDKYMSWWENEAMLIRISNTWGTDTFKLTVFANSENSLKEMQQILTKRMN